MSMITHAKMIAVLAAVAGAALAAACASSASIEDPEGRKAESASADTASGGATEVLRAGGTYSFSLEESDPSATMRAMCANSTPLSPTDCYAAIVAHGKLEKIRFAPLPGGNLQFTSFGPDDDSAGKDVSWIDVPIALAADGRSAAWASLAGEDHGTWAKDHPMPASTRFRFEVSPDGAVTWIDPKQGRLVFHKLS